MLSSANSFNFDTTNIWLNGKIGLELKFCTVNLKMLSNEKNHRFYIFKGHGYSSGVEHIPNTRRALFWISSILKMKSKFLMERPQVSLKYSKYTINYKDS